MPAHRSGGRRLTTHLGPEPQLDRRICARTGKLERDPKSTPLRRLAICNRDTKPRWEHERLVDGEAAATE